MTHLKQQKVMECCDVSQRYFEWVIYSGQITVPTRTMHYFLKCKSLKITIHLHSLIL